MIKVVNPQAKYSRCSPFESVILTAIDIAQSANANRGLVGLSIYAIYIQFKHFTQDQNYKQSV